MRKFVIVVLFAVLSGLTRGDHNYDEGGRDYVETVDMPWTLAPPTLQPGCVMKGRPCGQDLPRCCGNLVCKQTGVVGGISTGLGKVDLVLYNCLGHKEKVDKKIYKLGQNNRQWVAGITD